MSVLSASQICPASILPCGPSAEAELRNGFSCVEARTGDTLFQIRTKHGVLATVEPSPRRRRQHQTALPLPPDIAKSLANEATVDLKTQLKMEREGHVCLKGLFTAEEVKAVEGPIAAGAQQGELEAYRHRVAVLCPDVDPASVSSTAQAIRVLQSQASEHVGFLQMFNLHRKSPSVRQLVTSARLAGCAAQLLGVEKVRLYQDCLFVKQGGFAATNWHSDLNMVPLDTNAFVTFWIPLRTLEEEDSCLLFASGSHRDFAMAYWQSSQGMLDLQSRGYPLHTYEKLQLGDVTCHHGWTLHSAPSQPAGRPHRAAFTVSYFADGARVLRTRHARRMPHTEDAWSFQGWRSTLKEGQLAKHDFLPLVYPPKQRGKHFPDSSPSQGL